MRTTESLKANGELSNIGSAFRGAVAAASALTMLLVPGVSDGWLFVLAMITAYAGMTAMLKFDLVYGVLYAATSTDRDRELAAASLPHYEASQQDQELHQLAVDGRRKAA